MKITSILSLATAFVAFSTSAHAVEVFSVESDAAAFPTTSAANFNAVDADGNPTNAYNIYGTTDTGNGSGWGGGVTTNFDGVTSIGDYAFYACTSLSSITIPDSVTSIGVGLFYSCTSLSSITIPDGVTSIGSSAFYSCTSLASITIPDSVTSIGRNAFGNTQGSISFSRHLLEAAEAERDARLTMDEVRDARVGSTMIEVSGGKADITMTLEETSDLSDWSNADTSEKTIEFDAPAGTRFYRFKMAD